MRIALVISLFAFLASCRISTKPSKEPADHVEVDVCSTLISEDEETTVPTISFAKPFDIKSVKARYIFNNTSTIRQNNRHFYLPDDQRFYGGYNFFSSNPELHAGSLTVSYHGGEKWYYENDEEEFIEFTTSQSIIPVYDNIRVGSDVALLSALFPEPYLANDSVNVYLDNVTCYAAIFMHLNSKITKIRIGHYDSCVFEEPDKYIEKLIDFYGF